MSRRSPDERVFEAMRHRYRRHLLIAMGQDDPPPDDDIDPLTVVPTEERSSATVIRRELYHNHLPKLDEMGFIEWDPGAGKISKGSNWDDVEPLVRVIHENRGELPDELVATPNHDG